MSIIKNEIPILEYDDTRDAVIEPNHENLDIKLPKKCALVFLGEYVYKYAKSLNGKCIAYFENTTKKLPIYAIEYKGQDIVLVQAPLGSASAVQLLDWLISYGVREIISTGSCGVLDDFDEGTFLIPYRALRDEGTSYHYLKPSRFVDIDKKALRAIEKTMQQHNLKYQEVVTWSTDGFFRETKDKVSYRKNEGCQVVEMECSALCACSLFRKVTWGMILFTADSLYNVDKYDERNWGKEAYECALTLCLDSLINYDLF